VTDDFRRIETLTSAHLPAATLSKIRGESSEMLAHLAVFLLIILIACTLALLICWAYDTNQLEIEARQSGLADLEFSVQPHKRSFPAVRAALAHLPGDRPRMVIDHQRRVVRSPGLKRKHRLLRKNHVRSASMSWSMPSAACELCRIPDSD
jgi:hypothetical protein